MLPAPTLVVGIIALAIRAVYRTGAVGTSLQPNPLAPPAFDKVKVNYTFAQETLIKAVRIPTVSSDEGRFLEFHRFLEESFPLVRNSFSWETIDKYSLLLTWKGSKKAAPVLFSAHQDVVPVSDADQWDQPPFSGAVADGFVYGRGTLDMKGILIAELIAVETLIQAGHKPKRSYYFALGHDEETNGEGAFAIAKVLKKRKLRFDFVLDEGLPIAYGQFPGIKRPIAWIGVAEKGYLDLVITAKSPGGHGSMPFSPNAIHLLSTALHRISRFRSKVSISDGPVRDMLAALAAEHPSFWFRLLMRNPWAVNLVLPWVPVKSIPGLAAMTRTTLATTVVKGGIAHNVLPTVAQATVNARIRPGETAEDVLRKVSKLINAVPVASPESSDEPLTISMRLRSEDTNPSAVSSSTSSAFNILAGTIRHVFAEHKGAKDKEPQEILVAPSLLMGRTDSASYRSIADHIYRFQPVTLYPEDVERIHGRNERIAVKDFNKMIDFYVALMLNTDSAE
ncbi:uncharacterized protein EV422DRAFT_531066 [Fimicolochytrium jonesii]|uniref:uncharacterized protein n=1 Tax=Fimicolochytrium jonesii TaxID=1396493 RepID=UPI0022FE926D|nr:uncharacterized protein EV422DRAFT_531066 [Fimicolochytrium jonesii]KAI8820491.1 hypothetical protein EV422DRAFT_531066 [Fimicolochytrium jonesii]